MAGARPFPSFAGLRPASQEQTKAGFLAPNGLAREGNEPMRSPVTSMRSLGRDTALSIPPQAPPPQMNYGAPRLSSANVHATSANYQNRPVCLVIGGGHGIGYASAHKVKGPNRISIFVHQCIYTCQYMLSMHICVGVCVCICVFVCIKSVCVFFHHVHAPRALHSGIAKVIS